MLEKIKRAFWVIVFFTYALILGRKPGPVAVNFIKSLGFVFSGLALSKIFSLSFQIMSGRLLGRVEYGKFALAYSISSILWVFMYLAISTAMVKYLTSAKTDKEKTEILSTGMILTVIATAVFAVLFSIISLPLAALFSVSVPYILAAIVIAVCFNIWTFAQKVCQGLNMMKKLGAINVIWGFSTLVVAAILYLYTRTAIIPIIALIAGYLVSAAFMMPDIRRYLRPGLNRKWSRIMVKYAEIGILGVLSFSVIGAINKIFLNIFLSVGDVGLYQAYQFSTLTLASFFVTGFIMVFFPESSMYKKKRVIFSKVNRFLKFSPVLYVLLFIASMFILMLYGSDYTFMLPLLLLFVFAGVITSAQTLYTCLSASTGIRGAKVSTITVGITCAINIVASLLLIPPYGLYGAVFSIIISYIIGTIYAYFKVGSMLSSEGEMSIEKKILRGR